MSMRSKLSFGVGSTLLVTLVACGGADPSLSDFNKGTKHAGTDTAGGDTTASGTLGTGGKTTAPGAGTDLAACATQSATAEARPVYLVFMFDKSGSMTSNGSPKWGSAKAASKAFFESADSKGISASLTFFPDQADYSCNVSDYDTPRVSMAALPSTSFGQSLDNQIPGGGTPTYQALQGAISYAQGVATGQAKDGKVAIVLVTDGLPDSGCGNTAISSVKSLVSGVAASTLTYNQACTGGTGWQYDDANNPTRIVLCGGSCDGVKAKAGKVDILFGCATQTGPVK